MANEIDVNKLREITKLAIEKKEKVEARQKENYEQTLRNMCGAEFVIDFMQKAENAASQGICFINILTIQKYKYYGLEEMYSLEPNYKSSLSIKKTSKFPFFRIYRKFEFEKSVHILCDFFKRNGLDVDIKESRFSNECCNFVNITIHW